MTRIGRFKELMEKPDMVIRVFVTFFFFFKKLQFIEMLPFLSLWLLRIISLFHLLSTHVLSVYYVSGIILIQLLREHLPHLIIKLNKIKSPSYLKPWNTACKKENIWMGSVRSHHYSKYEKQNILTPNQMAPKPNDLVIFILAGARPQIPSCLIESRLG